MINVEILKMTEKELKNKKGEKKALEKELKEFKMWFKDFESHKGSYIEHHGHIDYDMQIGVAMEKEWEVKEKIDEVKAEIKILKKVIKWLKRATC